MTAALGWCWSTTRPPGGVLLHPSGPIAIATGTAPTIRERMRLQAAIISRGADLLPLAPAADVSPSQAAAISHDTVAQAFLSVSGQVQMMLVLTPQDQPEPPNTAIGRKWLHARKDLRAYRDDWCNRLHAFVQQLSRKTTQPTWRGDRLQCAIMIPRNHVDALKAHLLTKFPIFPQAQLVITGPWPPYSFTLPLPERCVA